MNIKPVVMLALGASLLGGCASTYSAQSGVIHPEDFGEANRQTYAAMIVNPDPIYTEPLESSAEAAADAVERVRERRVDTTTAESTTSIGSGGGGGGGS